MRGGIAVYDLLIRGARVVDGTGAPEITADVAVVGDRVVAVGTGLSHEAERVLEAAGLHLAPGFIDAHTHSDLALLADPRAASKTHQGVTTEVIGNCGSSAGPVASSAAADLQAELALLGLELNWRSLGDYLARLRQTGAAVNVVPLVGHNTVRAAAMGLEPGRPTPAQQAAMERLVETAMDEGARGLSSGLYYPPGFFADTDEVVGLATVAARHGGVYASHIRSESDAVVAAVEEAIEVGVRAGLPVEIAHVKVSGYRNWDQIDRVIETLDRARHRGAEVGCDQYPYAASSTWLAAMLPYWAQTGTGAQIATRLAQPDVRARLHQDQADDPAGWENRSGVRDAAQILVVSCHARPEAVGRTLADLAQEEGTAPLEAACDLLVACQGQVGCVWFSQQPAVVRRLLQLPMVAIGSDASAVAPDGILGRQATHPRAYGTFARVLSHYVRTEPTLSLPEAIRRMTSLPAGRFGLVDRGVIRPGAWADLVVLDAAQVSDEATFTEPHRFPRGITHVIVNGCPVIDQGRHTGARPGRIL